MQKVKRGFWQLDSPNKEKALWKKSRNIEFELGAHLDLKTD